MGSARHRRFYVPKEAQPMFVANWREREHDMQQYDGFLDFKLEQDGNKFVVSSRCASLDRHGRQHRMHAWGSCSCLCCDVVRRM